MPTKSFWTTTFSTPGRPATELSSTLTTLAPTAGGLTTRPCTISGTRTLSTNSKRPVTSSGRSRRGTDVPRTLHELGDFRLASGLRAMLKRRSPISSPYVTLLLASPSGLITPSAAVSWSTATPSRVAAISKRASRAVAPASAKLPSLKFTGCAMLPDEVPWSGVRAVSHCTSVTRLIGTDSSSATNWVWTVAMPWPSSARPVYAVTWPLASMLSQESRVWGVLPP